MIHRINGRQFDLPVGTDGTVDSDAIRQIAQIPSNRALIMQRGDGTNFVVNPRTKVRVDPADSFIDAPTSVYGG